MSLNIALFIIGSLCGSFLNVCIHRLPLGETVIRGRSHCPSCKHLIPWYDNIPLVSYWVLGRRCRFCKAAISGRYVLVELLTAAAFVFVYHARGLGFDFLVYVTFLCCLIVATFVDLQHRIIPDEVSVGGAAAGVVFSIVRPIVSGGGFSWLPLRDSLVGAAAGAGIIYTVGFLFDLVYFRLLKKPAVEGETSSMGGGDVKLMAMIGAFLGWESALLVFFLAPFFGLALGLYNLLKRRAHVLPYGPFLSLAAFVAAFWAERIFSLVIGK